MFNDSKPQKSRYDNVTR